MTTSNTIVRYRPSLVVLHWLLALLIIAVYASTYVWDCFPRDERGPIRDFHKLFGLIAAVLILARIVIRTRSPALPVANPDSEILELLSRLVHAALYLLMVTVVCAAITMTILRGAPLSFWGVQVLPALVDPASRETLGAIKEVHVNSANLLMLLVGLHFLAAIYHQYIKRDGLMSRLTLGK